MRGMRKSRKIVRGRWRTVILPQILSRRSSYNRFQTTPQSLTSSQGHSSGREVCQFWSRQPYERKFCSLGRQSVTNAGDKGTWVMYARHTRGQRSNVNAVKVDTPFLREIDLSSAKYCRAEIGVNRNPVMSKLDSGAFVWVISDKERNYSRPSLWGVQGVLRSQLRVPLMHVGRQAKTK